MQAVALAAAPGAGELGFQLPNSCFAGYDQHIGRPMGKQAYRDDAGNLVDAGFHFQRVGDRKIVDIENVIAIVSDEIFAPDRLTPHFYHFPGNE